MSSAFPRPAGTSRLRPLRSFKLAALLALRIARSRKKRTLSVVSWVSVVGIACGVLALTVVLAVTDGFERAFEERILGIFPHMIVMHSQSTFRNYDEVLTVARATDGVVGATPVTADDMMAANGPYRAGANVEGIDLPSIGSVLDLEHLVLRGSLAGLDETPSAARASDAAGRIAIAVPVESQALTFIARDADVLALSDERVIPDPGNARVKVLDLRGDAGAAVVLEPVASAPSEPDDREALRFERPPGKPAWSREREVPHGLWRLPATDEKLVLEPDRALAIVFTNGPDGRPRTTLLTAEAKVALTERHALVRVVDLRTDGEGPAAWSIAGDAAFTSTLPGEQTGYRAVRARLPGVLLGSALAAKLHAEPGGELTFVTPLRGLDNKSTGPFGMLPSSAHFAVVGIFEAGFHEQDSRLALVNIDVSQRFLNRGKVARSVAVKTKNLVNLDRTKAQLRRALDPMPFEDFVADAADLDQKLRRLVAPDFDPRFADGAGDSPFITHLRHVSDAVGILKQPREPIYKIIDWREKNDNLFRALTLQRVVLTMFFFIIILVGSFVIVGSQIMVIHEKTADIAILKAMGASAGFVRLVFTLQGLVVAMTGLIAGLIIGVGVVALVGGVGYHLDPSIYLIDHLPAHLDPSALGLISVGTLVCTLLTTQLSAGRAAKKAPVSGLRQID